MEPQGSQLSQKKCNLTSIFGDHLVQKIGLEERIEEKIEEKPMKAIEDLRQTSVALMWAHFKLSSLIVHAKAINFILDCDFYHFR